MVFVLGKFDGISGLGFDVIVVGNATLVWYVSLKIIIIFFLQFLFQGLRGLYSILQFLVQLFHGSAGVFNLQARSI